MRPIADIFACLLFISCTPDRQAVVSNRDVGVDNKSIEFPVESGDYVEVKKDTKEAIEFLKTNQKYFSIMNNDVYIATVMMDPVNGDRAFFEGAGYYVRLLDLVLLEESLSITILTVKVQDESGFVADKARVSKYTTVINGSEVLKMIKKNLSKVEAILYGEVDCDFIPARFPFVLSKDVFAIDDGGRCVLLKMSEMVDIYDIIYVENKGYKMILRIDERYFTIEK